MSEVGALIVKLQAETAQFRLDMGKVKSDLDDLKDKAGEAGDGINVSMTQARGGLMLVENVAGVRLPRALNTLLAGIPGVGAAFQMMLPIAGVLVAIEVVSKLIEHHHALQEAADQLKGSQASLAGTIGSTFTGLNDKLLQAGIAADDLNGNHLAAVRKQLELIDHQSMAELAQTFDTLAKAADQSFTLLKAHWYEFSAGSEGAKHSLETFQAQYEMLLKTGKTGDANKLLDDKIARERTILQLQQQAASTAGTGMDQMTRRANAIKEMVALTGQVVDYDDKSLTSERDLVDILQAQVNARATIAKTAAVQSHTAEQKGGLASMAEEAALQKVLAAGVEQHSQALVKLARTQAETVLAANKGGEDQSNGGQLAAQKAAVEAERDDSIAAAKVSLVAKEAAYDADVKAAGQNAAKKKELNAQWVNEQRAASDSIVEITAEANKQIVALDREAANQSAAAARAAASADDPRERIQPGSGLLHPGRCEVSLGRKRRPKPGGETA